MSTLQADYKQERYRGGGLPLRAIDALRLVRYRHKPLEAYGWTADRGETLTSERDGFTLRASWTYDDAMSLDDMGYGSFDEERGADRWAVPMFRSSQGVTLTSGDHANTWYHPMYSGEDWYTYVRARGASRAVAAEWTRSKTREEARLAAEATEYVITVTAFRKGVELGSASLGGVGFDPDEYDHAREVASIIEENGLADQALEEARSTLAELTA